MSIDISLASRELTCILIGLVPNIVGLSLMGILNKSPQPSSSLTMVELMEATSSGEVATRRAGVADHRIQSRSPASTEAVDMARTLTHVAPNAASASRVWWHRVDYVGCDLISIVHSRYLILHGENNTLKGVRQI